MMWLVWGIFGLLAILQATRVSKVRNPWILALSFVLGPFGFLGWYFFGPKPS